jgi:hypothetical protein
VIKSFTILHCSPGELGGSGISEPGFDRVCAEGEIWLLTSSRNSEIGFCNRQVVRVERILDIGEGQSLEKR